MRMANEIRKALWLIGGLLLWLVLMGFIQMSAKEGLPVIRNHLLFFCGLLLGITGNRFFDRKPWVLILLPTLGIIVYMF